MHKRADCNYLIIWENLGSCLSVAKMIGPAFSEDDELLSYLILRFTNIHAGRMMCSPNLYQNTTLNLLHLSSHLMSSAH